MRYHNHCILLIITALYCPQVVTCTDASVDLHVAGEGFHRTFTYRVIIDGIDIENCYVALHLALPQSIYANVDEVADFKRLGKTIVCLDGETDVELFAEKADSQNVSLCTSLKSKATVLTVPLHERYQYAREGGGYIDVEIEYPKLLLGCENRAADFRVSEVNLCHLCTELSQNWQEISYSKPQPNYVWKIPVGNVSYFKHVSYATLFVTSLGALAVLWILVQKYDKHKMTIKDN